MHHLERRHTSTMGRRQARGGTGVEAFLESSGMGRRMHGGPGPPPSAPRCRLPWYGDGFHDMATTSTP
jgi:hypothetical protein